MIIVLVLSSCCFHNFAGQQHSERGSSEVTYKKIFCEMKGERNAFSLMLFLH